MEKTNWFTVYRGKKDGFLYKKITLSRYNQDRVGGRFVVFVIFILQLLRSVLPAQ